MPNDGYIIQSGTVITGSVITKTGGYEVCRYTLPANTDARVNALCIIQNQSSNSDGYTYWLEGLVTKEDGYVSFVSGETLTGAYNATGTETEAKIAVTTSEYDIVWYVINPGSDTFRFAVFANTYSVDNVGIVSI